jgi:hemerythrin superfamily protein
MSATSVLVVQHRAIGALFNDVVGETRRHARSRGVARLAEELIAHIVAEEAVFYPAVRRALRADGPGVGRSFAPAVRERQSQLREGHLELRVQLRRVLETNVGDASFGARLEGLRSLFDQHVQAEETQLFPCVEAALGRAELEVLGARVLASRPPVWIVTAEGRASPGSAAKAWALRRRVSLPAR